MKNTKTSLLGYLLSALKGAVIGTGAILPGISGGVLCVAMGVYRPIMELLTHPIKSLKENMKLYLPLLIGFIAGVLGLSRLVDILFRYSPTAAIWLFIGLIAGTLPAMWREAGREGHGKAAVITGVAAFAVALTGMLLLQRSGAAQVEPNIWIWVLCGALWGVGIVCPGMSPSSIFIFMGVYQPMAAGIADFDLSVLLPMGAGLCACVLTLSQLVSRLLKNAYAVTMHFLLGVALASMVVIIPTEIPAGMADAFKYALCFIGGFAVGFLMERARAKTEA